MRKEWELKGVWSIKKKWLIHSLARNQCVGATQQALRLSAGCILHAELTLYNIKDAKSNTKELENTRELVWLPWSKFVLV